MAASWKSFVVLAVVSVLVCRTAAKPWASDEMGSEEDISYTMKKRSPQEGIPVLGLEANEKTAETKDGDENVELPRLLEEKSKTSDEGDSESNSKLTVRFPEDSKQMIGPSDEDDAIRPKKSPGLRDQHLYMRQHGAVGAGTTVCIHVRSDHSHIVCGPQAQDEKDDMMKANDQMKQPHASARFAYQPSPAEFYFGDEPQRVALMRGAPSGTPMNRASGIGQPKRFSSEPLPVSPITPTAAAQGPSSPFLRSDENSQPKPTELSQPSSPAGTPMRIVPNSVILHRQYIPTPQYMPQGALRLNCAYQPEAVPIIQPMAAPVRTPLYSMGDQLISIPGNNLAARMVNSAEDTDEQAHFSDNLRQGHIDQLVGSPLVPDTILGRAFIDEDGTAYIIDENHSWNSDIVGRQWDQHQIMRASEGKMKGKVTSDQEIKEAKDQMKVLQDQVKKLEEKMAQKTTLDEEKNEKKNSEPTTLKVSPTEVKLQAQDVKKTTNLKSNKRQAPLTYTHI